MQSSGKVEQSNDVTPLVSVIIPVYNNENSIEACILSVVNQTYDNLQIIVVNDGSSDNTLTVIVKYAAVDNRIVYIDQPNRGVNLARKTGLDIAKGKYVQYLDGDDFLLPDAIWKLVEKAEATSADIVSAPFIYSFENGTKVPSPILQVDEPAGIEYFRMIFDWTGATWNMWGNFQKRSLVYDYNVEILSDMPYGQDATWMVQIFFQNPKIVILKEPILHYNQNSSSVTYSKLASDKRYRGSRMLYDWFCQFLQEKKGTNEFGKELAILHLEMTFRCIHSLHLANSFNDMKNVVKNIKRYPGLIRYMAASDYKIYLYFRRSACMGFLWLIFRKLIGKL